MHSTPGGVSLYPQYSENTPYASKLAQGSKACQQDLLSGASTGAFLVLSTILMYKNCYTGILRVLVLSGPSYLTKEFLSGEHINYPDPFSISYSLTSPQICLPLHLLATYESRLPSQGIKICCLNTFADTFLFSCRCSSHSDFWLLLKATCLVHGLLNSGPFLTLQGNRHAESLAPECIVSGRMEVVAGTEEVQL